MSEAKRRPKKSGIVFESKKRVMILVRLPKTAQANSEPIKAFPKPIHVEATPKFQPNWPA